LSLGKCFARSEILTAVLFNIVVWVSGEKMATVFPHRHFTRRSTSSWNWPQDWSRKRSHQGGAVLWSPQISTQEVPGLPNRRYLKEEVFSYKSFHGLISQKRRTFQHGIA